MDAEAIRMGHIGDEELHAGIHQHGNEGQATAQAIELGDYQSSATAPTFGQSKVELGPIIFLAGRDLSELGDRRPVIAAEIADEGLLLRLDAEAGLALPIG